MNSLLRCSGFGGLLLEKRHHQDYYYGEEKVLHNYLDGKGEETLFLHRALKHLVMH